jgi:RimJ/RimL family protein N-acetyltransferase
VILETARLILGEWQPQDSAALRTIATDPEVMLYITGGIPWTDERIQSFVDSQIELYRQRRFCRWKLTERSSGEFAGFCGVGHWRDFPDPEIGWWLARRLWGRGLATEAARTALGDAVERARLPRIVSIARSPNAASIRVMQKIGLHFESEFEIEGIRLVRYGIGNPAGPAEDER